MRRSLFEYEIRTHDVLARVWLQLGDHAAAVHAARAVIDLAPFLETAYARLMEGHLGAGNRAEAITAYGEVRSLLADTMGIEPTARIQSLYEQALG